MSETLTLGQVGVSHALQLEPTVLELEDMLYDILASGADPNLPAGTLEAVQTFLHEHARSKRALAEFVAFFTKHKLSMARDTGFGLGISALDLRTPARISAPDPELELEATRAATQGLRLPDPEPIEVAPVEVVRVTRHVSVWWAAAAVVLAAISGGALFAALTSHSELERARAEQNAMSVKLAQMQSEVARLRGSVEQTAQTAQTAEHKSELVLQTFGSPLDPQQR